jgi:putative PIN family toxin of toxin-antitoxin system
LTRVVADSNIFVSAIRFGGRPAVFLQAAEDGLFVLVVSETILAEVGEVLSRKFEWSDDRVAVSLRRIRAITSVIAPDLALTACEDPDDDRILEAAVAGNAKYIVSGDKHLLRMGSFRGIEIVRVRDFWECLRREENSGPNA